MSRPKIAIAISVALRLKINWTTELSGWLFNLHDLRKDLSPGIKV
jgi:hypothetical protein